MPSKSHVYEFEQAYIVSEDTRKMVLELCKMLIERAGPDSMITRHMAQRAEKICERLGAGNV